MQAVLVMFRSDGERRSFSVTREMTVIGRREDCDLRIPHGDVSRKHCRLVRDAETIRLEDLGSSNGTYHNGLRVDREAGLNPGDSIQVGPVVFVLQINGVPDDDELSPITSDYASHNDEAEAAVAEQMQPMADSAGYAEHLQEPAELEALKPLPEGDLLGGEDAGLNELEPLAELEPVPEPGVGEELTGLDDLASLDHGLDGGSSEGLDGGLAELEPLDEHGEHHEGHLDLNVLDIEQEHPHKA